MGVVLRNINCFIFLLQNSKSSSLPLFLGQIWLTFEEMLKNERLHILKKNHIKYLEQVAKYAVNPTKGDIIVHNRGVGIYSGFGGFITISENGTIVQDNYDPQTMKVMRWARRT